MKSVFQYIAAERAKRKFKQTHDSSLQYSKEVKKMHVEVLHFFKEGLLISLGVLAASFGLLSFLLPNGFLDGGVTGISLIVAETTAWPLSILIAVLNIPFLLMAFSTVGRQFALRSIVAIIMLSLAVHFLPWGSITNDKLLVSVFGGFFLGLGIGLAVRGGAVIDGTEVLAVFISRKTALTIGDVILVFNVIIFSVAAYVFDINTALYAVLTYMAASRTVDFVVSGVEEYIGVNIISDHSEEIRLAIIEKLGRGCTIYTGKKGYAKRGDQLEATDIIYTLVTRLELASLQTEIEKIDSKAFVVMHKIRDAKGGMIKKRPLH